MTIHAKLLMAALTAALVLSFGASSATALRSISLSNAAGEVKSTGRLTVAVGSSFVICNITFARTVSSAFPKTHDIRTGKITGLTFANCGSEAVESIRTITILGTGREIPELAQISYDSFLGRLPNPQGLLLEFRNLQWLWEYSFVGISLACLYEGPVGFLDEVNAEGVIGRVRALRNRLALISGPFGCPGEIEFRTELEPERRIRITLL